jgi:hypothetical protein
VCFSPAASFAKAGRLIYTVLTASFAISVRASHPCRDISSVGSESVVRLLTARCPSLVTLRQLPRGSRVQRLLRSLRECAAGTMTVCH